MADAETRVVDPKTGGAKGSKIAQLGAVDPAALLEVARVAGFGGQKYDRGNFLKGYAWSLSFDALMRHLLAFWDGEETDPESGMPHMAHAAWHCLALISFSQRKLGTDDRYHPPAGPTGDAIVRAWLGISRCVAQLKDGEPCEGFPNDGLHGAPLPACKDWAQCDHHQYQPA